MRSSHRTHRLLIVSIAVLALLAAPVAARTLTAGGDAPAAGGGAPAAPAGALVPTPTRLDDVRTIVARHAAHQTARAVGAARRAGLATLVDKRHGLPARHRPRDLVAPRVPFLAGIGGSARLMRRPAARALERLFTAARRDGTALAGVSGFRSHAAQRTLFAAYARERGVRRASRVSARAGHSEHQTGLVMDVSGADGRCAASACFAGTRPARWLARHAPAHGFVIRYPAGRRAVTGYAHEPWHLRYVGVELAREAARTHRTLDELLGR